MSDQQNLTKPPTNDWDYNPNDEGAIQIPVRVNSEEPAPAAPQTESDDEIVREYEERYYGPTTYQYSDDTSRPPRKSKQSWNQYWDTVKRVKLPPRHRYDTRPAPEGLEENERTWAALAHGSALLTFIAVFSTGPGAFFTLLIPLGIYLMFRRKSEYVAFHALQAFTLQTVCTVGAFALLVSGSIILVILILISALFSLILVGIPFLLLFIVMLLLLVGVTLLAPVLMLIYGMIAAHAAWNGRNYRYPYVADWVDDQLSNGMVTA